MPYTQDEMDALLAKAREKERAKGISGAEQGDEMDALLAKAREKERAMGIGGATKQPQYSWPSWLQPEDKETAALVKKGQLRDALQSGDEELAQEIYSSMVVDEVNNTIGQWSKDHVKEAAQSIYKPREINRPAEDINQRRDYVEKAEEATFGRYAKDKFAKVKDVRVKEKVEEDDRLRGFTVRKHAKDIVDSYIKENPDKEEYRGLYELYVADEIQRGIVVEQTKEERLRELQEKTNEIYKRSGWFSSLVPDWRNRTLSLITLMPWFTNDDLVGEDFAEALNTEELDFLTGIPWLIDEATGRYQARSLSKNIDAYLDPSFGKGFLAEFDHSEVPSFGMVGLVSELDKLSIVMKVKDGEELSAREKDILELMQIEQEAMALDYELNGEEWNAASLGRGVGFSTEIISQIILGMVATGGVGNVATLSAQGGKVFVQQGVKQGTKAAVKKVAKEAVEEGIKQVTKKEAAVILAKNAGVLAGRSAIATAASPMTWHNFLDRRVGQYSFDENGEIVYTEQSWASDLFKAYTESFFEYYSEMLGAEVGALINLSPARLGRIVGLSKWGKAGAKSMDFLADISSSYSVRTALNKVGMQGLTGEVLSEVGGDVMTNLMLMPFYDEYNMQFLSDPHYWGDVVMTSGILGAAHTTIGAATGMSNLGEVRKAIKTRDLAFSNISDAALADELKRISTLETTLEISEALANLKLNDKTKYSDAERAIAMEYITNDLIVKASYGAILEGSRLERFYKLTRDTNNLAYEDSDRILTIKTKDGKMYYVKNGDIDDANSMLNCIDAKGNKVAILASEVQSSREATIGQTLTSVYDSFYMRENIGERLMEVESTLRQMKEPTREKVQAYLEENGLTIFKEGDVVTLADGTQGSVESVLDNGDYVVKITDPEGEVALIQVPALQVLQPNAEVAKAQKIMFKQKSEKVLGDVSRAIENEQKAEATPQAEDTTADDAKTLEEDEKELMSTFPVTEDGSPDFDAISSPKQYALLFAKEMGGKEAAHAQMQQMKTNAVEEAEKLRKKGKKLSKANDVVKNNKAIAELEQRISFYDEVLNNLQVKQDVVEENVADNVEEAKEAMDKAEAIAKEPRHAYKVGDVVDHNGRNARVIEVHDGGVLVIDYSMGASVVGDTEVVGSDEVTPSTATIPANVLEENVEEQSEGLVMNGFAKRLTPRFKKIVDALARLLKVKVVFVETLGDANGYISGTTIYLSYAKRDKGVGFLTGHEVTHRLQEVAPEAYAKFKKAAKKYLGKEWDKEVNKTIATYEEVNRRRTRKAQAVNDALKAVDEAIANGEEDVQAVKENLAKLEIGEDKEVALAAGRARTHVEDIERELGGSVTLHDIKTKLEAEQASPEPLLKYTKDAIEDEVTADVAGKMSEKYFAIDKFLRGIDDSRLKRIMRDIWQFIKDLFTNLGADTEANRARKCVEKLNALIAEGIKSEATQKRKSKSGARPSLIGEVGAEALDRAEEATTRLDNLAVAREMENAGKDAKAIRMATGWERGADGLWRYEIMDAKVNLYNGDENTIRKKIEVAEEEEKDFMQQSKADTKELRERTNTYLAEMREKYGVAEGEETDAMTEEEIAQLQSLTNKEIEFEDYKERRRNELYNRRMALEAQLGYVRVKNTDASAMVLSTRLGHILQGNDAEVLFTAYPSLRDIEVQFVTDIRDGAFAAYATKGGYKRIELNAKKTPVDMIAPYILHEVQHAIQDIEGFAGGGNLNSLQSDENVTAKEAYDYYRKIAGEVEARNVSARINMTPEERRATLLSETEDVAREDQIFLREGVEMAMAEKMKGTADRNASEFGQPTTQKDSPSLSHFGAKLRKDFESAIGQLQKGITTNDKLGVHEFLYELDNALTGKPKVSKNESQYVHIGNGVTLRLSDHYSNAKSFDDADNNKDNFGIVIRAENENRKKSVFKKHPNVDYVEYVYYPDKLDKDRQLNILQGVVRFIKTKDFEQLPTPDDTHVSVDKSTVTQTLTTPNGDIVANENEVKGQAVYSLITPEMDASYLDAVERGDMATAQRMVMEAAEKAGYTNDESWRMNHRAPRKDEENANPFNTEKIVPEDFWEHPEWYTNIRHSSETRESYYAIKSAIDKYKRLMAEGKTDEAENVTITMYRGVDKTANKREASFRNGDWITPSRSYALSSAPYGKARVISQEVKLKDIWWDGNSINEWGYDDGANYGYSDTKNNRKLLDPVTYDDNGNVIPLSERFNPRREDIRYSLIGEIGAANIEDYGRYGSPMFNLEMARELEAMGKRAKKIRLATNWERGADGKWRYEIMDGTYNHPTDDDIVGKTYVLNDILDNDYLFEAYPDLADMTVVYDPNIEGLGAYDGVRIVLNPSRTNEEIASTLLHEVQHAIQHREMFARGGNKSMMEERIAKEVEKLQQEFNALGEEFQNTSNIHLLRKGYLLYQGLRILAMQDKLEGSEYEAYRRLAGEVEARNVQKRMGMSEDERLNTMLEATEDVARKDQEIIFREAGVAADAQEEGPRYSISGPSYTDRMVDITPEMSRAEHKAAMLEEAKRMASEGVDAQMIVDETGWIELEDGWHYYGDADIVLSDAKSNMLRVQRWLESKRAVKRAQVRKLYAPLIKEQEALISDLEKGRAVKGRTSANYANAVEAILDGQAVESLPIEDQILVDIALGQKLRWEDEKNGSRRGLATELGLHNAKDEGMEAVTRGAKDYVEDYVAALVERNNGYENGINDNDVRNTVIEAFRSYPSRQAALDELSARYPNAATTEAREGIARLEFERDETLAEIDAEHRATMEDFEVDPERYMREYEDAQAWNESIDVYTQSLAKARNEIKRLEREAEQAGLTQREKDAAIAALKSQVRSLLSDGLNLYMRKREIQAIMNAVNEAQTTYAMARAVEKAMWSIYEARMRMELTRLNNLLRLKLDPTLNNIDVSLFMRNAIEGGRLAMGQAKKLMEEYFKGVNGKGISVARYIDGDTATIMGFIAAYSDLKGMATTEGFNIDALCEELREALMGENIDHKYVTKEKQKAYSALDASVRDRMLGAVPIIRGLLEAQQLINGLQQSSEVYAVTTEIEDVKREIDTLNAEIAEIENEGKVVMQGKVYKDKQKLLKDKKKQLRDLNKKVVTARIADAELYLGAMPNIVESLDQLNGTLETLVREGRIRLSEFHQKREERRRDLVNMAIEDIDRPAALGQSKIQYSAWQKIRAAKPIGWSLSVLESIDHLLRVAARNAPDGEGQMWNHFVPAIMEAEGRIFDAQTECYNELSEKTKSLFGTDYDRTMRRAERTVIGEYVIPFMVEKVENGKRVAEKTTKKVDLTISQAMDILAMWNQPNGKETLIEQGFKESDIAIFKEAVEKNNPNWLEFQQWVVNTYLPAKRVKYNKVHREMNGVDMDYEVNYFPMRRNTQFMPTHVDISSPDFVNTPSSSISTGAIIKRQNSLRPFDLEASFFNVLKEHLVEMEQWSEMAPVTRDFNLLLSSPTVKKALESVGEGFYQKFVDAAKVVTGNFKGNEGWYDTQFWQAVLRRWASGRLAAKAYTALKQAASSILFLQYAKSPSFIFRLLYHYTKGTIGINIKWALENSAMFRKRWASGTAGYDLFSKDIVYGKGKTRLERTINDILKAVDKVPAILLRGIALVDAFTSAAGMRAVYEEEMVDLMKQGLSKSEAHDIALFRAEIAVNKTQQSSENLYLSPVQKSKGLVARSLTTFMNAPIAQGRNIAEAIRELGRNRETERREVYKQERKRWKEYYHPWYEAQEETIKKEKEQGIIETAEQEEMRRRQLYKEVDKQVDIMTEKTVGTRIKRAKKRALLTIFLNAWIAPAVFNLMNIAPYMLMGDDDEEKEKMMNAYWLQTALGPLQVLPLGPQIVSAFTGYKFDVSSPLTAFSTDINNIVREVQEQGFSVDAAMLVGDFILEHGMGVDVDTLMGMYAGIESLFEDGYSREAVLMMMGAPNSQVRLLARERKEGETAQEYYTRLMRLYSILEDPKYEDYYTEDGEHLGDTPFGMKEYQMRDMRSNWEYAYRLDVVNRNGKEGEYSDMVNTTDLYKENAKLLPSVEKTFNNGEFRENTKIGDHVLSMEEYKALYYLRKKANKRESDTEHFLGQDEQEYLKWLRKEVEAKRAFNDKLSEITNK